MQEGKIFCDILRPMNEVFDQSRKIAEQEALKRAIQKLRRSVKPIRLFPEAGEFPESFGVLGVGQDLCEVAEMLEIVVDSNLVLATIFTPEELAYCQNGDEYDFARLTAHFAGKEAVIKAIGGIPGGVFGNFSEIEIEHNDEGAPAVRLSGRSRQKAEALGIRQFFLTISHESIAGIAGCIAVGEYPVNKIA